MYNKLVESIKKVNEINFISNDYKLPKKDFKKILKNYIKDKKLTISEEIMEFLIFINGKMFFDWVVFKSKNKVPVFGGKIGDIGLFYSLKDGTQYYSFGVMKSNNDIIGEKDFLFAEATPGDYLIISFDAKDYGKIYFISHDSSEKEKRRYLVANTIEELIENMFVKEDD